MDVVAYANMQKYLPPYKYLTLPRTSGVSTQARQMGLGLRSGGRATLEVGLAGVRRLGSKLGSQAKVGHSGHSGHSLITKGTINLIATWNTTDEPQYIS